jgi:hypothetical protein
MNTKDATLKVIFGVMIFAFSLALSYFAASYFEESFDYWGVIMIFALVYIVVGVAVSSVLAISLGFLFSADILILNLLFENFGDFSDATKVAVIGIVLIVLYAVTWFKFGEVETAEVVEKEEEPAEVGTKNTNLNDRVEKVDISGKKKVTFYPIKGKAFFSSEPNIIRIVMFTEQVFEKNDFKEGELDDYYNMFVNSYKPSLPKEKVKIVLDKLKKFADSGGRFEVT